MCLVSHERENNHGRLLRKCGGDTDAFNSKGSAGQRMGILLKTNRLQTLSVMFDIFNP